MNLKQHWPWIAGGVAVLVLLWLLSPILTPFVVGAGLAYLGDPIVDRLQKLRMSRTLGVVVVFVVLSGFGLLLALLIVPLLQNQFITLLRSLPDWLRWLQDTALPRLGLPLPDGMQLNADDLRNVVSAHWNKAGGIAMALWDQVTHSGPALFTAAANLLLVPIVSFYLLRDWDDLVAWVRDLIPPRHLPQVSALAAESDEVLGAFIRGQLLVMAALAAIYSIGLWLAGVNLALVIGIGAGLVSFVPYLGFIVGISAASIAVLVQTGELLPLLWVAIAFGVGQVAESAFLTPNLVGDRIGLHPVAVIFAVMAGGQLFGFIGVLLALPAAAVIAVLLRHTREHWLRSALYRGQ
ncbi:MAG TPA: AI-2E family transporter [Stenotrophobium sp.]|jgi:predicted PurR-regulated permease PerM|nr:AI-2E family transporter [Stenotrophobium sp.]